MGHAVGQGLGHQNVPVADRLLGTLLSGATVLLLCWVLLSVATALWPHSRLTTATDTSCVVATFDSVIPNLTHRIATPSDEGN